MLIFSLDPFPELITERLLLRQFTRDDVPEVFFLRSDSSVLTYINKPAAKSEDEVVAHLDRLEDLRKSNEGINWGITIKGEKKVIGYIGIWNISKEHYRAEVGYVLHPSHHRKGIMHEALKAVCSFGFTHMKLHSLEAKINPNNNASAALLEKTGFVREAYFREDYHFEGKFLDTAVYSLLSH